ncbi:ATP-binding cassette protein subfamily A, member 4 [Leishmania infantum JPCM5]|uniref:ATP-binding_cassette_protein_subfamily_A n=2 Tax=Leishmania infantum TaxID=5671 RepID=A0A6L0WUF3_LEIIN|nr:ATP-binding cassette protein subfamily A, member 4 [Leishmania infantum JPCM5]CAC9461684.1 ATP-binding_cassette_protein_subfamily_A [Leishmania infantum]CAM66296.1 ATP-binding cassette protein subfamily A, member 4 [Leishmania infantum JPCM5]SUZ39907.1 ATP-binding_cassette_protein_subfamily_A [Leishmania infantum]|eukprot:XP_001463923.1 ATP-binding cassette protein subfamily A, member 4 [Leishmania infantum JPCM5]
MGAANKKIQRDRAASGMSTLSPPRSTREPMLYDGTENSPDNCAVQRPGERTCLKPLNNGGAQSGSTSSAQRHSEGDEVELRNVNEVDKSGFGVVGDSHKGGSSRSTGDALEDGKDKYDVYMRAVEAQRRSETSTSLSSDCSSFCFQLVVTVKRMLILQSRDPLSLACELITPILFLVGSIILWGVIKKDFVPASDYFSVAGLSMTNTVVTQAPDMMCYNATLTGGVPIEGLLECTDFLRFPFVNVSTLLCAESNITGAPVGLCVSEIYAMNAYSTMLSYATRNTTRVPTLDEMILLQWAWRLLYYWRPRLLRRFEVVNSAMLSSGALYFAPASTETEALVAYLQNSFIFFKYIYGGTFATVAEAEARVQSRTWRDPPIWGIVQVNNLTAEIFDVAIRLNATALPPTRWMLARYYVGGVVAEGPVRYILSGFTTLQQTVYQYFLTRILGTTSTPSAELLMLPAPTRGYRDDQFLAYGGRFVLLILVLGFLYPVSKMTKRIVLEKELRLREAMLIMGLSEVVMYTAWFLIYVVQYAAVSLIMAILLRATYLTKSNFGIVFFLLFFFSLSIITLSGLMAVFFNKARLSAILAPLIYFALSIPIFTVQNLQGPAPIAFSFLSPSGLAVGVTILFSHELSGGMTGSDLTYFRDSPKMLAVIIILFMDFIIYLVLMLYLDAVLPKQWGTRKHPLFFIMEPVRWFSGPSARVLEGGADGRAEDGVFEEITEGGADYAVCATGLRKEYSRGGKRFVAVNNLYWGMREGEISVLLGHNGAGKTTTMNMMTGMVSADAGDCYIYGYSVRNQLEKARQQIGYCPQHNILWPNMTCYEHLWYYAALKGLRGAAQEEAISRMLAGVDLQDKRDCPSKMLSGGQKRKLSVAVAFVGCSRLVFLDEPTAGMDVGARRYTWGLLRAMAKYHTILLSTHFMDEADLLGDSVAIMSKGCLQCAGSNMFLKAKLGVGYVLTLSVVAHVDRMAVSGMVREHVPSATRLGSGAGEMAFRLPMKTKEAFSTLLAEIEGRGSQLGVSAYSVSATTLEEVFIQIAQQGEAKEEMERKREQLTAPFTGTTPVAAAASAGSSANHVSALADISTVDGVCQEPPRPSDVWNVGLIGNELGVLHSQFKAMLWKRLWNALRDRRTQFFQIACPMLCVLLAMLLTLIKLFQYPAITLSSDLYGTVVEIDVVGCESAMNLSIPFSSKAVTVQPPSATSVATLSSYMLETYDTHLAERYTGLVCADTIAVPVPITPSDWNVSAVIYNTSGLHSSPIGLYNLYNGYYMAHRGNNASALTTVVQTMPKTKTEVEVQDSIYALIIAIVIMIPFTFIPSTFVSWIVKERECKARHLQNVSGLYFSVYWLANFLFDICCYVITMFLVIIVLAIFSRDEYIGARAVGATIVLFFLYGLSGVAMAYAVSFLFKEHSTAQNVVMLANFITGFLLVLCVSMLSVFESTKKVANALPWIFRVVPSFCVGEGISNLAKLKLEGPFGTTNTPWSMSVVGWPCVYMAAGLLFYVLVTLFVDHPGRRQRTQRLFHDPDAEPDFVENEDEDVMAERRSVLECEARQSDLVRVENMSKVYSNGKVAVRNVTFAVHPGEVFGFLGTNGAGKTTTISILCQEIYPTTGRASICGNDIVTKSREALQCIGYCPQFDPCLDLLTVKEHLELYAGVRAISYDCRKRVVEGLLALCELTNYKHTLAHDLSGGNRRKLSVALSLIGGPRVVFLDEPSAGMDPVARRGMWTAIQRAAGHCSVVLTTQDAAEVEALAHRVAIMVDGTLRCIGDKTHLKNKFGTGFEVNVRIRSDDEALKEAVQNFFSESFPGSSLRECCACRLTYKLPPGTKLSRTFRLMEEHAPALGATDYSVSQTSIEQVFMQISEEAERQHEAEEAEQLAQTTKSYCTCCC